MADRVFVKDEKQRVQIDTFRSESYKNWAVNTDESYVKESVALALNFYGCPHDWYKTRRAVGLVACRVSECMGISVDQVGDAGAVALCLAVQELYEAMVKDLSEFEFSLY